MNEPIDADYDYADEGEATNCIHISYIEQAGGWLVCDECGEDVTLEIYRANQQGRAS